MSAADHDWMDQADCRRIPGFTELSQPEQRTVCTGCPVRMPCVELGLAKIPAAGQGDATFPLFGGLTPDELRRIRRNQQRAEGRDRAEVSA